MVDVEDNVVDRDHMIDRMFCELAMQCLSETTSVISDINADITEETGEINEEHWELCLSGSALIAAYARARGDTENYQLMKENIMGMGVSGEAFDKYIDKFESTIRQEATN